MRVEPIERGDAKGFLAEHVEALQIAFPEEDLAPLFLTLRELLEERGEGRVMPRVAYDESGSYFAYALERYAFPAAPQDVTRAFSLEALWPSVELLRREGLLDVQLIRRLLLPVPGSR